LKYHKVQASVNKKIQGSKYITSLMMMNVLFAVYSIADNTDIKNNVEQQTRKDILSILSRMKCLSMMKAE
jgi:hypothetical protein